jgi:AmmeMemoRadiSam system protein B
MRHCRVREDFPRLPALDRVIIGMRREFGKPAISWRNQPMRSAVLILILVTAACSTQGPATAPLPVDEPPPAAIRPPLDTRGYAHSRDLIERLIAAGTELEGDRLEGRDARRWIAGISPHDDHLYAGRVYIHLFPGIEAKTVILFGVCHKARSFGVEDVLVFDSYPAWHGPYGSVAVSDLRERLVDGLGPGRALVSNRIHDSEHSVEGLIPFLQHWNRPVRIVPVLVPAMSWERMDALAGRFADLLASTMKERKWTLGDDVALLISNDCVHYGDEGWGGKTYADFGVDRDGYLRAVGRDLEIIRETLEGPLDRDRIRGFFSMLVQPDDHRAYAITWCGRYCTPFGLACLFHLHEELGLAQPAGTLLRYGTTLAEGEMDLGDRGSLGVTAPRSLRHWVGFCSVGFE